MKPASPQKKTQMKYAAIIGAGVGVALFAVCYTMAHNWSYLFFIPIASAMAWATQYVKMDEEDD